MESFFSKHFFWFDWRFCGLNVTFRYTKWILYTLYRHLKIWYTLANFNFGPGYFKLFISPRFKMSASTNNSTTMLLITRLFVAAIFFAKPLQAMSKIFENFKAKMIFKALTVCKVQSVTSCKNRTFNRRKSCSSFFWRN